MNKTQNPYSVVLCDFDWFVKENEKKLIDSLYDLKLLDDFELREADTKKTIVYFLLKNLIGKITSETGKCVFLVKPEILHVSCSLLRHYNNQKLRRLLIGMVKFLVKNKFNVFVFLTKSYSNEEYANLLEMPEVRDFIDIHVERTAKKLSIGENTALKLFEKLSKKNKW